MPAPSRHTLYKLLAMGRKACGWSEDQYRECLAVHGATETDGRISATTMTDAGMLAVLDSMAADGYVWKRKRTGSGPGTKLAVTGWRRGPIGKLNRMWCLLADDGHVYNRSEEAMHTWCRKRVPGITRLEWATAHQLNTAIEELKRWAKRLGYTEDALGHLHPPQGVPP